MLKLRYDRLCLWISILDLFYEKVILMKDVMMFEKLREYLTKEYMRLSNEKEELLSQKISLETEELKNKDLFFNRKKMEEIKNLFYPFQNTIYLNSEKDEENENNSKIQKMEINVKSVSAAMEEIKEYITFIQSMVKEKEDTFGVSDDLKEMLLAVIKFLESQYSHIEFLTDFDEGDMITSTEFNGNLIRILTYTISSTIESIQMDSVILDVKHVEEKISITIYMLLEDEVLDYYTYDFNFVNR